MRPALAAAALIAAVLLAAAAPRWGLSPQQAAALGLLVGTVGLWATIAIPEAVTSLGFFATALLLGTAPPEVVLAGFTSAALWLTAGGLVLAAALRATGLADRMAAALSHHVGHGYPGAVAGMALLGTGLAFLMPSAMGRVLVLVPLAQAIAVGLGFGPERRGAQGLALAAVLGTMLPGFAILTANVPNLVLVGAAEALLGAAPGWSDYLLWNFPVLGLLKLALVVAVVVRVCPDRLDRADSPVPRPPASAAERRLLALLLIVLALWMTDRLHGLPAAGVALAAAVLCLLPGIGVLDPRRLGEHLPVATLVYVAAVLGLARVVDTSGLDDLAAARLLALVPLTEAGAAAAYATLVAIGGAVAILAGFPVAAAVLVPLTASVAAETGAPAAGLLMAAVASFSVILLPYQEAPIAVGMQLARLPVERMLPVLLLTTGIALVALTPLHFLWLVALGVLPW